MARYEYLDLEDPRIDKLPVWAQAMLRDAEKKVRMAREDADEVRMDTNPDETDTVIARYDKIPVGLPAGEIVRFWLSKKHNGQQWVDVHTLQDGLRKVVSVQCGAELSIHSRSSNVIYVTVDE